MDNENDIERFPEAQDDHRSAYDTALAEMRGGRKINHWIWYVLMERSYGCRRDPNSIV